MVVCFFLMKTGLIPEWFLYGNIPCEFYTTIAELQKILALEMVAMSESLMEHSSCSLWI